MNKFLWLVLFLPMFTVGQDSIRVDVSNPHATIYTHLYFLQSESYEPKKAAQTIVGLSEEKAIEKVIIRGELLNLLGFLDIQKTALRAWNRSLPSFELRIGLHLLLQHPLLRM